ncbi:MAG: hypothetical protein O7E57_03385, partial [Gammaproteobacteria bacterium]|nr:hypothetical protein [Gammaproteobacteria bacterium]
LKLNRHYPVVSVRDRSGNIDQLRMWYLRGTNTPQKIDSAISSHQIAKRHRNLYRWHLDRAIHGDRFVFQTALNRRMQVEIDDGLPLNDKRTTNLRVVLFAGGRLFVDEKTESLMSDEHGAPLQKMGRPEQTDTQASYFWDHLGKAFDAELARHHRPSRWAEAFANSPDAALLLSHDQALRDAVLPGEEVDCFASPGEMIVAHTASNPGAVLKWLENELPGVEWSTEVNLDRPVGPRWCFLMSLLENGWTIDQLFELRLLPGSEQAIQGLQDKKHRADLHRLANPRVRSIVRHRLGDASENQASRASVDGLNAIDEGRVLSPDQLSQLAQQVRVFFEQFAEDYRLASDQLESAEAIRLKDLSELVAGKNTAFDEVVASLEPGERDLIEAICDRELNDNPLTPLHKRTVRLVQEVLRGDDTDLQLNSDAELNIRGLDATKRTLEHLLNVPAFPDVVPGGIDEAEELRASLKRQRVILGELDPEVDRLVADTHDSLPNIVMLRYRRRLEARLDSLTEQTAENLVQKIRCYLRHPEMWVAAEELLDGIEELQ